MAIEIVDLPIKNGWLWQIMADCDNDSQFHRPPGFSYFTPLQLPELSWWTHEFLPVGFTAMATIAVAFMGWI